MLLSIFRPRAVGDIAQTALANPMLVSKELSLACAPLSEAESERFSLNSSSEPPRLCRDGEDFSSLAAFFTSLQKVIGTSTTATRSLWRSKSRLG